LYLPLRPCSPRNRSLKVTKQVVGGSYGCLIAGPSVSPLFLTACQMFVCAACTRLQPRSHASHNANAVNSGETTRSWTHKFTIGILMSGALICANYAYVDLPIYFIQICKVLISLSLLMIAWDVSTDRRARSFLVRQRFRSHGSHNVASRYPRINNILHIQTYHQ